MAFSSRPQCRNSFNIAIICTLPVEADAVGALFDEYWDQDSDNYGKANGDTNAYITGRIGHHNVVLAFMPDMGKSAAAGVAASLRSSYPEVKLAFVVGVCGGVPKTPTGEEVLLGDVIISDGIVQYDFGRQHPDQFVRRDTLKHTLHRPGTEIRSFLAKLKTQMVSQRIRNRMTEHLLILCKALSNSRDVIYPGPAEDKLFKPTYYHKHHANSDCATCCSMDGKICLQAQGSTCEELNCDENALIVRKRLVSGEKQPVVHFGLIASGDTLMRSAIDRDRIASREKVIAFEMEGAGVWDILPCLLIKGVSDYADSHKNKRWQGYSAAVAAACLKAFLEHWSPTTSENKKSEIVPPYPVEEVGIEGDVKSSVVATTLSNTGNIRLRERKKAWSDKGSLSRTRPAPRNKQFKPEARAKYKMKIGGSVTSSVVASALTNIGDIKL